MQHRTIGELMTRGVVGVRPDTPFKKVVGLLADHDVTALPVVDDLDQPVGVVSEADLLRRVAAHPDPNGWPSVAGHSDGTLLQDDGTTAGELMTAPAVCARPGWTVVEAARLMDGKGVKRLPVIDEAGTLVGIVSRGDLLRVFLRRDEALRDEITRDVLNRTLGLAPNDVAVDVHEGRVSLKGNVESGRLIRVIERLCRGVDGVVSVEADLTGPVDGAPEAGRTG
ncbi:CBS domain-containing protein [Streptomyces indiaensis]|uniref:CBS domain-containing protein n=1 Tax=Streptomyces indiaensis TaxID=284033 RepID=A0ABN3E1R5_9ACTN|nr:CBS domain-containing protein [Streptomyces indiaensis]MCF1645615.1 CBS domain-containing protein [Streptomyces indiaensis]